MKWSVCALKDEYYFSVISYSITSVQVRHTNNNLLSFPKNIKLINVL